MSLLMVFLGGGFGALCRYGISKITASPSNGFPIATFLANLISCLVLGMLIAFFMNKSEQSKYQLLLITGFCGGFSTFSSFSSECYNLLNSGQYFIAIFYILSSVLICLLAIYLGIKTYTLIFS